MTWYLVVKFLHIAAVIVSVGGIFARQLLRRHASRMTDIQSFATFSAAAGRIESTMVIPGMAAILVFGILLAFLGHYPILGFLQGGQQNWLLAAIILLISIQIIIPTIFVPRGKKFEPVLQDALARGEITPELRTAMNDRVVRRAHYYEEIAVILIAALMVLKPF